MSNSLTGPDNFFISKDFNNVSDMKKKLNSSNNETGIFKKMLSEKTDNKGNIVRSQLTKDEKKLYDTCIEMESLLWKQVLSEMRKTTGKYKLIDGGQKEKIFTDFLYDEYSSMMAKNSNTGIADTMFKQLSHKI